MMDENRQSRLLFSLCVCAMIRALGMQAENEQRKHRGESMAYDEEAFASIIGEFGIGWNDAIGTLNQ